MSVPPVLVFVHGIGRPRDAERERRVWLDALGRGHDIETRYANYSDLLARPGAQGGADDEVGDPEFLLDFVSAMIDDLDDELTDPAARDAIEEARAQLELAEAQGVGRVVRHVGEALTAVFGLPGLRRAAQWTSGRQFLGILGQLGRYLGRGEDDLHGRVRQRVLDALPTDRPAVVVAHSMGSVVTFEALHQHSGPVPLLVTMGSPLTMTAVVVDRLVPKPPTTPECVRQWLNFWDADDIVVARPRAVDRFAPNSAGVRPVSRKVRNSGVWTHTATKYLAAAEVAEPVIGALGL